MADRPGHNVEAAKSTDGLPTYNELYVQPHRLFILIGRPKMRARISPRRYLIWVSIALVSAGAAVIAACSRPPAPSGPSVAPAPADPGPLAPAIFEDVTASSGVDFTYRNGEEAGHFAIIESLGGGVALFDFDGDGLLDIFFTGGGHYDGKNVM